MIPPGSVRSARQNHGPPVSGMDGPHQASSINSSAHRARSPARMASPVLAAAPTVQSLPIGCPLVLLAQRRVVLEAPRREDDAVAGPHAAPATGGGDDDTGDAAVLDVQVLERRVQHDRDAGVAHTEPQGRRQRLAHDQQALPGQGREQPPSADTQHAQDPTRVAHHQRRPPEVGLGDRHVQSARAHRVARAARYPGRAACRRTASVRPTDRRPARPAPPGSSPSSRAPTAAATGSSRAGTTMPPAHGRERCRSARLARRRRRCCAGRTAPLRGCRSRRRAVMLRCWGSRRRRRNARSTRRSALPSR